MANVTYIFFRFDINLEKILFTLPAEVAIALPEMVYYSQVNCYLPSSLRKKTGMLFFSHAKRVAIHCFNTQEACSSGGSYSTKLRESMIDRKGKGYITLSNETCKLRAAEVFDGGMTLQIRQPPPPLMVIG